MTNLPINTNNTSASTVNQQFSNEDVSQIDVREFSNLLARQVAGSAKKTESSELLAGDDLLPAADKDKQAADMTAGIAVSTLPADILATLMGQQNLAAIAQADLNTQSVVRSQLATQTTASSAHESGAPLVAMSGKFNPSEATLNVTEAASPKVDGTAKETTTKNADGFSNALMLSDANELKAASNILSAKINMPGDVANSAQQSAITPPLPGIAATSPSASITTPLSQQAWGDEFSQKITWMVSQRNQSAELHLNPPQLGPLDVVLKINGDQATAMFTSPHAAVRDAIEQAIPRLREMLADNGIMLGNAMVNDQAAKNNQDRAPSHSREIKPDPVTTGINASNNIQETRISGIKRHDGMVDTFA